MKCNLCKKETSIIVDGDCPDCMGLGACDITHSYSLKDVLSQEERRMCIALISKHLAEYGKDYLGNMDMVNKFKSLITKFEKSKDE